MAIPHKPPETAFWARLILADLLRGWKGGRVFAKQKLQNAKVCRFDDRLRLALYSLRLRFKVCQMPPKAQGLKSKAFPKMPRNFYRTERTATGNNFMEVKGYRP